MSADVRSQVCSFFSRKKGTADSDKQGNKLVWPYAVIGHRTAAKNRCAQSIWGLNFGQTKHEIACRDWNHWGNAEKGGNKTLL